MNPEQWLSLKWNGGSTMSDRWLNQSKIIHTKNNRIYVYMYFGKFIDKYYNFSVGNYNKLYDIIF